MQNLKARTEKVIEAIEREIANLDAYIDGSVPGHDPAAIMSRIAALNRLVPMDAQIKVASSDFEAALASGARRRRCPRPRSEGREP